MAVKVFYPVKCTYVCPSQFKKLQILVSTQGAYSAKSDARTHGLSIITQEYYPRARIYE